MRKLKFRESMVFLVLVIAAMLHKGHSNMVARCFPEWEFRHGSNQCYRMPKEEWVKNFKQAREFCTGHGGDSLIVKDQKTLDWVKSHMEDMGLNEVIYTNAMKVDDTWIWMEDHSEVDTSLLPIDNQSDGDCGTLTKEGKLRGVKCDTSHEFMCHRNIDDPPPCDYLGGWEQMFDHCYLRAEDKKYWEVALSDCQSWGASLIAINNETEQQFAKDLCRHETTWIGMTEDGHPGTFKWIDEEVSNYTHWQEDEPDDKYKGYGRGVIDGEDPDGKWMIMDGLLDTNPYLCEKEQGACVYGWETFGDSCYYFNTEKTDSLVWENANDTCAQVGAHLMIIETEEENEFIRTQIDEEDSLWIGLKSKPDDDFYWIDGSLMSFSHMSDQDREAAIQADEEKCVDFHIKDITTGESAWSPMNCHLPRHYICEIKQGDPVKLIHRPSEKYCPSGWQLKEDECYFFSDEEKNFTDARKYCQQNEADLVSIGSWAEQDYVHCQLNTDIYIGYKHNREQDNWFWLDGTSTTIENWDEGEPGNEEGQDCGMIFVSNGKWHSLFCKEPRYYVCERTASDTPFGPIVSTTSPSTTGSPVVNCGSDDWVENPNTGECYHLNLEQKDHNDARSSCYQLNHNFGDESNAHSITLLTLGTAEEYEFVLNWLQGEHLSAQAVHLGLWNDLYVGSEWDDDLPVGFYNWEDEEPSSPGNDGCTRMYLESGKWDAVKCYDIKTPVVCEKKGLRYKPQEPLPPPEPTCPEGWIFFNFYCYYFSETKLTWEASHAWCESHLDSSLASVMNSAENDFLNGMAKSKDVDFWIGLRDNDAGTDWHWSDGSDIDEFTNWNETQPDDKGGIEHCGQLRSDLNGHWNDLSCEESHNFVCKMTIDSCPEGWKFSDKKCYFASEIALPHDEAQSKCQEFNTNSDLATINNDEENQHFAESMFHGPVSAWNGYVFNSDTKKWYWKDGSLSNYTNWNAGEPNNLDTEFCTEVIDAESQSDYEKWNNILCSQTRYFGCQYFPRHYIGCEDGWIEYGDYCYTFIDESNSYPTAKNICESYDANALSIHSEEESQFVYSYVDPMSVGVWLGINDIGHTHSFKWDDGSPLNFTDWAYMTAEDREPLCGVMESNYYTWEMKSCNSHAYGSACKKPKQPIEIEPKKSGCQGDDKYYKGSCYTVHEEKLSWDEAKTECESKSRQLLKIEDKYEGAFFMANLGEFGSEVWNDAKVHRYEDESVDFRFDDGELVTYLPWDENQPDLNNGECLITTGTPGHEGFYRIAQCDTPTSFICEYDRSGYTTLAPEPTPTHGTFCYDGWDHHNGHCYKVIPDSKTWREGEAFCQSYGGHLASINSEDEKNAIYQLIKDAYLSPSLYSLWVGLELDTLADKHWSDGSPIDYLIWDEGQPKMHEHENCASIDKDSVKLSCTVCESHLPIVCEAVEGSMISTVAPRTLPPTEKCDDSSEGDTWYLFQDHCYKFVSEVDEDQESWMKSRDLCQAEGAYLASVTHIDENYFIESMFSQMSDEGLWLGGRATEDSGWEWVDGTPFAYDNWDQGEPNHCLDQEDCIEMYNLRKGAWNDKNCGHTNARVCKRPNGATHSPPVPTLPPAGNCPKDWVHVASTGRCFKFVSGKEYFDNATNLCQNLFKNTELVSIHSPKELAYITAGLGLLRSNAWIGMKYESDEYVWVDQSIVDYTPWAPGEPSGLQYDEYCVEVTFPDGLMNDISCNELSNYVCAMKQDPSITEPSTFPKCDPPYEDYFNYKGECYRTEKTPKTWEEAEQSCAGEGAHLASAQGVSENAFMWILAQESENQHPWIGLNNKQDFNTYEWSDGWPELYSRWGKDQPDINKTDARCVKIDADDGLWYNENCDDQRPFLCKYTEDQAPSPEPPVTGHCPEVGDWMDFKGGFCYLLVEDQLSWNDANGHCAFMDSNLTSIHSESETKYIKRAVNNLHQNIWIGLIEKQTGLGWSDGTAFNYENWDTEEPSSDDDQCTEFYSEDGTWNDVSCYSFRPFVCQTPKRPDKEPTNPTIPPVHSTTPSGGGGGGDGLSSGAIAGIVISVLLIVAVVGFAGVSIMKKRQTASLSFSGRSQNSPKADTVKFSNTTDA